VLFVEGAAGSGKTTFGVQKLQEWLNAGVAPESILVLVPQRTLGQPYQQALAESNLPNAFDVSVVTFSGLAQRALNLYWPRVAQRVIPDWQGQEPTYLNIETAQYYMAQFLDPLLQQGYFDSVNLDRSRLIAQILTNLSASAVNSFTLDEVEERLIHGWPGHSSRITVYQAAMQVARNFREYGLQNAVLDFSLQVDLFVNHLLKDPDPSILESIIGMYQYVISDNTEEHSPVVVDFLELLWPALEDGLILYDTDSGYRVFLGATPDYAYRLKEACSESRVLSQPAPQQEKAVTNLAEALGDFLTNQPTRQDYNDSPRDAFTLEYQLFYPQMVDWAANQVIDLVRSGVPPREIVILAPFLGDSLRFTLFTHLEAAQIPYVSHRPSRAVRDEPVARAVLTLMKLAYPGWDSLPPRSDISQMLVQLIDGLDPIRAELLAQVIYRPSKEELGSFDLINPSMQARITYIYGERYEKLRQWLADFREDAINTPPDHFMSRLFELGSQEGFGFHSSLDAGRVIAEMIDSAYRFRVVVSGQDWDSVSTSYIRLVGEGVLAGFHLSSWQDEHKDAVFIAPAYTFLMRNRFVDHQIWLDVGSTAWFERLEQPVTHPYLLRRDFPANEVWSDEWEFSTQNEMLRKVLLGLLRRCRKQVYLGFADLGEQGFEQRGPLLRLFNRVLQQYVSHE
jgi:hypothetical protein